MISKKIIYLFLFFVVLSCKKQNNISLNPLDTVPYVDIEKFMGDWYVIANIPTIIEKNAFNAIENYKLNSRGEIETTFSFYQNSPNGNKKVYTPKGYIYNKETNAEWRMEFLWPIKLPFLIIDLAEDYSYTVIGYPNREYVWIMSRNIELDEVTYGKILNNLELVGYDISKIKHVPQIW